MTARDDYPFDELAMRDEIDRLRDEIADMQRLVFGCAPDAWELLPLEVREWATR